MLSDIGLGEQLKAAFRRYPTGVAIITAAGPVGFTASSVASVAVDPPALSFSVLSSRSAQAVLAAPSFVVNLLGSPHVQLAHDFARPDRPRFAPGQGWDVLPTGEPVLATAVAAMRCTVLHQVPVGSSTVIIADVRSVLLGPVGDPLIHLNRQYLDGS